MYVVGHMALTIKNAMINGKAYDDIELIYPVDCPLIEHLMLVGDRVNNIIQYGVLDTYKKIIPGLTGGDIHIKFDTHVQNK